MAGSLTILLAVHNGGPYLGEQIASLAGQTFASIDVVASDDGSSDDSADILASASIAWAKGDFAVTDGPCRGFAENFRSLITNADTESAYFAFCDQDDVWDPRKLEWATEWLDRQDAATPALFCSRTRLIDAAGRPIGLSPLFAKPPSFRNALVQSIAGGNTMVMNRTAFQKLAAASRRTDFVSHDWWAYQIVTGCGGMVHYAPEPLVSYRQHTGNVVGSNMSVRSRLIRYRFLLRGGFSNWTLRNLTGLKRCADLLTEESVEVLGRLEQARQSGIAARLRHLMGSGVYRQTMQGNVGLYLAAAINRL